MPVNARTRTRRTLISGESLRATRLLAFRHLAEQGKSRLEIEEIMKISRPTYYRLRADLAELREHDQRVPDDD